MPANITFEKFMEILRDSVDRFEEDYKEKMKKDEHDHYPNEMYEEDWFEQFVFFLESE